MKLMILFLILFSTNCTRVLHHPEGGYRPKEANFRFAKTPCSLKDVKLIDTNTIYIEKMTGVYAGPSYVDTLYTFYRFFKNCKVYVSNGFDHFPSNDEINNLNQGMIGYYKIKNNEILTEIFLPINLGQYKIEHGKIKGDTLIFYKEKHSLFSTYTSNEISKILVKYKNSKLVLWSHPDW